MHSGWSRHVLMALMNKLPYLVDLFVRIPVTEDPAGQHIVLTFEGGHPLFILPSPLPAPDQLICQISHHLHHLLLQHPFLAQPDHPDTAWHLALDAVVDQLTPPEWKRFQSASDDSTGPAPQSSLFQTWSWFASHPHLANRHQIEAIAEHRLWKHPVAPPQVSAFSNGPGVQELPDEALGLIDEQRQLINALQWRSRLTTRAAGSAMTRLTWTHHRRSRRYGTFPGIRISSRGELVIILDTSGSMSSRDIHAFFEFLPHMSRIYGRIIMVEADYKVRAIYPYRRQTPHDLIGRGDTFFQPAIDAVLTTRRPDAIWYVTDGQSTPPHYSATIPLTWLICGDHAERSHLDQFPGNYLFMKNKPATSGVITS